jgi:hypothetical protein
MILDTVTLNDLKGIYQSRGFIHGAFRMAEGDYHASPGWSSSQLTEPTLSRMQAANNGLRSLEESDAMRLGTATHCWILERDKFPSEYAVEPAGMEGPKNRKKENGGCKELWDDFKGSVHGRKVVTRKDFAKIEGMANSVANHTEANATLIDPATESEVSLFWVDEATGIQCRARCDSLHPILGIMDLKTTSKSAAPENFYKSIKWGFDGKEGYWLQRSHYLAGLRKVFPDFADTFRWLVVETTFPHDCSLIKLSDIDGDRYDHRYRALLSVLANATEQRNFPAYGKETVIVGDV